MTFVIILVDENAYLQDIYSQFQMFIFLAILFVKCKISHYEKKSPFSYLVKEISRNFQIIIYENLVDILMVHK